MRLPAHVSPSHHLLWKNVDSPRLEHRESKAVREGAEAPAALARSSEMDGEEKRSEQSAGGSGSHGGGKVCHRCGWAYPNAHPSKKNRAAHRKHCNAAASKPADGVVDEEASDRPGEATVVEDSKSEGAEGKAAGQTRGESVELSKGVILDSNIVDGSPETHVFHHNNEVQSSNEESTVTQLVNSAHPDNHSVRHEDTENCSLLPAIGESLINASEEASCAAPQNAVGSTTIENNNNSDLCVSELLIIPHDFSRSSSATDAGLQKIDKNMESSAIVDTANAVTSLSGPHEVSANTGKPEFFIRNEVDKAIDLVGQSFLEGKCTSVSDVLPFDDTNSSEECNFQIGKDACSFVNPSEPEDQQTFPVRSGTNLVASPEMKSESIENYGSERTDSSPIPNTMLSEVPNAVLSALLVVESEQNTNNIFSNIVNNEGYSHRSIDDKYHRDESNGSSQLATKLKLVESITKLRSPDGEPDCLETEKKVGLSGEQEVGSGGEVTNSCKTCYPPTEFQGHNSHLFHEGTSSDHLRNEASAVGLPNATHFSATAEIITRCEILSEETTRVGSEVAVVEEEQKLKEESFCGDPKADSQPEGSVIEPEYPFGSLSDGIFKSHFDQPHSRGTHQKICNASVHEIIEHRDREVTSLVYEAIKENGLPDDHCTKLNIHEGETSNTKLQDLQNVLEARNDDPVNSTKNDPDPFTSEIGCFHIIGERNIILDLLNNESTSNDNEVSLCHDGEEIPNTSEYSTAKVLQSFNEKIEDDCNSKTNNTGEDSSIIFYQSSKEKDINEQTTEQVDSYTEKIDESIDLNHQRELQADPFTGKIDDSINSTRKDGTIEAILSSVPEIASPRNEAIEGFNCNAKASPPTDSQVTKDLCVSDDTTAGAFARSNVKNNEVEGSSALVVPEQIPIATGTELILNSKDEEPKGRNISCDVKALLPTDSQATGDLCISDDPTTGGAPQNSDDSNSNEAEVCSLISLAEPGRISKSTETGSILNSKQEESKGRNIISCDAKPPSIDSQATKDLCISDDLTAGGAKSNVRNNGEVESYSVPAAEPGRMSVSIEAESIPSSKDEEPEGRNITSGAKVLEPTDSCATKDLHTCDDTTASAALPQSNVENNGMVEGSSLAPLVGPGQKSISIETESMIIDSKHEADGRNISDYSTAVMLSCNSGKPHVMLKNLLAEANTEGKQMNSKGAGDNASLLAKNTWDLQDGHSDKPKEHSMSQADLKEWNSPARLPLPPPKHEKKKSRGKQSWVPFICCPSSMH